MRMLAILAAVGILLGFIVCPALAADEPTANDIVANPDKFVNRDVEINGFFRKIDNVYSGWEDQANLKPRNTIKFFITPFHEIPCYASRTPDNEKIIGEAKPREELLLKGHVEKKRKETKIKGERDSVKRTVKGAYFYIFRVTKVEVVEPTAGAPEGAPPAAGQRMRRRRRGI